MPQRNTVGGKAYKKNKKGLGTNDKEGGSQRFVSKNEGQDYGRVTRLLGNRRVMCFCNDGLDRVCKIRGGICRGSHNRQKIEVGDIVLISYRDYDGTDSEPEEKDTMFGGGQVAVTPKKVVAGKPDAEGTESAAVLNSGKKDIADILMKYDRSNWRDIRKEKNIHGLLFPASSSATATTGVYSADDIFEDVGENRNEIIDTNDGDKVKGEQKMSEKHDFLDDEDLVIDDI